MAGARGVFQKATVDQVSIRDEPSFRHVPLYAELKEILRQSKYVFRILPQSSSSGSSGSSGWNDALLLNLTYWDGHGGDVLESDRIAADVIAHAAWHHLAFIALGARKGEVPSAHALFLGESIASAFDAYVVGRLLAVAPRSSFLKTQVPAMAEAARAAGLSARGFRTMLERMVADAEASFEGLREMLYDAASGLVASTDASEALDVLVRSSAHPFGPLLHHYELSNWVLYARAYAKYPKGLRGPDARAGALDSALRRAPSPLGWLRSHWVGPALLPPKPGKPRRKPRQKSESGPASRPSA